MTLLRWLPLVVFMAAVGFAIAGHYARLQRQTLFREACAIWLAALAFLLAFIAVIR